MAESILTPDGGPSADADAYAAAARAMREEEDQAAQAQGRSAAFHATNTDLAPERAAQVLDISKARGVAPAEVADNFDAVHAAHTEDTLAAQLQGRPGIADYMQQSPAHAALVKNDVPVLSMLWDGLKLGTYDIGAALLANKQAKTGLTPEEESSLTDAEQQSADGVLGATTLPRKVGAEIARATPTLALFGSAALAGGAAGSVLGPAGAAGGALLATAGAAYTLGFGPLYRRLRGLTDEDGTPLLDDDQAKAWASGGAAVSAGVQVAVGTPFLKALPGMSQALQRVGLDAAARTAQTTLGRAAVQRLGQYGGHVLSGALAMAGQSATNAATVEFAKGANGAEPDWSAVTDAAADGFKIGLLLAPLAVFDPLRGYIEDRGRIRDAHLEAARIDGLTRIAQALQVKDTAPAEAERVIGSMADGQTVYISSDALTPEVRDRVAEIAGPEAMAEAEATKGAVAVPVEKYLVQLGDQHDGLREDVKLSADGMTVREAKEAELAMREALTPEQARELYGKLPADEQIGLKVPIAADLTAADARKLAGESNSEKTTPGKGQKVTPQDTLANRYGGTPEAWGEQLKKEVVPGKSLAEVLAPPPAPPPDAPGPKALKEIAGKLLETKRLGDIQPGRYEQDARRAADRLQAQTQAAAERAAKPGQEISATKAMVEVPQLEGARDFSRALARASADVRKEADKNRNFLLSFTKDDKRAELGKAGADHLEQVDRLLSGFELGQNAGRTEVARRQATMDWIARENDAGRDPIIPDSVLAKLDRFVHWKEMTPGELRDLRNAVESIARQAELKNTLLDRQTRKSFADAKLDLVGALRDNTEAKAFRPAGSTVGNLEKALDKLRGLKYGARAIERVINTLDGGDINGPWHRYVWDPINDSTYKWHDMVRTTTEQIVKVIDAMPREDLRRWRETRFKVNGVDYDLSAAVAVALNSGNDSNRSKMLRGWQDPSVQRRGLQPWTQETPEEFLRHLTRADWNFVGTVWDRLESMWPEAAALEKRLTGLEPESVKPVPFTRTLEDGTTVNLKGGYYPVIYDSDFSRAGAGQAEGAANRSVQLFDRDYYRAATPQGYLQKRIEGFARPVLLSVDSLPHKISESAKDITMREALLSVHTALTDDTIRAALQTSELGRQGEQVLLGWLRDTANDLAVPDNGAGSWFNFQSRTRAGYTASIFAYNIGQTAQNLTAITEATRGVGPKWMTDAMLRLVKERGPLLDWMRQQSDVLRNSDRGGQAVADAMRELSEKHGLVKDFMQFGMKVFQSTDIAVKYPTWLGEYSKAIADKETGGLGMDHETAVRKANETVRLFILAGDTKDQPALLRSRIGRWMLPLFSYNLHRLNMVADAMGAIGGALRERAVGRAAVILGGAWGAFGAEAVLSEIVKGNGPGDENGDGEIDAVDAAIWTAKISALAPLLWLPVFGSAARAAATGKAPMGAPEQSVMGDVGSAVHAVAKVGAAALSADDSVQEEDVQRLAMELLKVGGDLGGVPSQIHTTAGYLLDENSPKEDPLQIGLGVAFGKKRPGKLISLTE